MHPLLRVEYTRCVQKNQQGTSVIFVNLCIGPYSFKRVDNISQNEKHIKTTGN
jgi:hypothetical protein